MTTTETGTGAGAGPEEEEVKPPTPQAGTGRWGSLGQPVETSSNFGASAKRLIRRLEGGTFGLAIVSVLALLGVGLSVLGPRMLGDATDILITGMLEGGAEAIDFDALHRILYAVLALYVASAVLSFLQSFMLAGIVQRTMYKLRSDVEDKLNRLPLSYVDEHARGDLLSRVTNDIDNIAMSLQQTMSQMLTSILTLVGTLVMMIVITEVMICVALCCKVVAMLSMSLVTRLSTSPCERPS